MRRGLILGRASAVLDEAAAAKTLASYDEVIVINVMGRDYHEPFQHWATYHPELFQNWMSRRRLALPAGLMYWTGISNGRKLGARVKLPLQYVNFSGGSSGLLAVKVALIGLGLDRVVLCGVPMSDTPRYDDHRPWTEARSYQQAWRDEVESMAGRVRSLSGWTADLLGVPDADWLGVGNARQNAA